MDLKGQLILRILSLDGVEARRSRFRDAAAFLVGRREFAHFHDEDVLDIRLTRPRIRELKDELAADPRVTMRGSSDWLEFAFANSADIDRAFQIVSDALDANSQSG